jgi:hypothetical protein
VTGLPEGSPTATLKKKNTMTVHVAAETDGSSLMQMAPALKTSSGQ